MNTTKLKQAVEAMAVVGRAVQEAHAESCQAGGIAEVLLLDLLTSAVEFQSQLVRVALAANRESSARSKTKTRNTKSK